MDFFIHLAVRTHRSDVRGERKHVRRFRSFQMQGILSFKASSGSLLGTYLPIYDSAS